MNIFVLFPKLDYEFLLFFFFYKSKGEYIIYYTQAYLGEVRQIWRQDACATDTTVDIGFNE